MKQIIRLDMNGVPFEFEKVDLDEKEISKIVHEINNVYYTKYKGKSFAIHRSLDLENRYAIYFFEIRGFDDYNIYEKYFD